MFVSNTLGAKAYVGSLKFCDLVENGICKWCNAQGPGYLYCLLYQESSIMISYSKGGGVAVAWTQVESNQSSGKESKVKIDF